VGPRDLLAHPLGKKLDADILVFHEHWMGLLLTSPFLFFGARALRTVSRKAILSIIGSGVLGSALGTVCFTEALALLNSSLANLLLNVQPIISVLVSWVWLQERPRSAVLPVGRRGADVRCGDGVESRRHREPAPPGLGLLFIGATALCWGASTTFGRAAMLEIDFKTGTALRYLIGTLATFALAGAHGHLAERLRWGVLAHAVDAASDGGLARRRRDHADVPLLRGPRQDARVRGDVRRDGADVRVPRRHLGRARRRAPARTRSSPASCCSSPWSSSSAQVPSRCFERA
jgi:uncharacterized membrane protein